MSGLDRLKELMERNGDLAVLFSGGADSTLVALAGLKAGGISVMGIMMTNPAVGGSEVRNAKKVAEEIGLELDILNIDLCEDNGFLSNSADRCARCREISIPAMMGHAKERGFGSVADGANIDDLSDHRPGMKVSDKMGIWHPLVDAGLYKSDVRSILRDEDVSVHNRPSSPCLATRIPCGQRITVRKLEIIEKAELSLSDMGFLELRVRLHEEVDGSLTGVIEVDDPSRALDQWNNIHKSVDIDRLYLDPGGYRSGSCSGSKDP